jgi:Leucine-rich repeat (LRR) protein
MSSSVLRKLNVARNNISEIDPCALCNTSIAELDLGYNRFAEVTKDLVAEVSEYSRL